MREATALVERVALRVPVCAEPVIAGFRANGALSIYFGADPVYQFDPAGRLRRAYVGGKLYRSQGTTLAELVRRRGAGQTVLSRRDLESPELAAFLDRMAERLAGLRQCLIDQSAAPVQTVPPSIDLRGKLADALRIAGTKQLSARLK
jgi:hypothetical protein